MKTPTFVKLACALSAAILVAACSGGHSNATSSVVPNPSSTGSGTSSSAKTVPLTISIQVPKKLTSAGTKRPAYVSPNTYQIAVTALPDNVQATGTCGSNLTCSGSTISVTISVPLDTTALNVVLQDSTGYTLSQISNAPVTITAGTANSVNLTFDGTVNTFSVAPTSLSFSPTSMSVQTIPITLTPTDYDGNPITPPGNIDDGGGNVLIGWPSGSPQNVTVAFSDLTGAVTIGALTFNAGTLMPLTASTLTGTLSYTGSGLPTSPTVTATVTGSNSENLGTFTISIPAGITFSNVSGGYSFQTDSGWTVGYPHYDIEVPSTASASNVQLQSVFIGSPLSPSSDTCISNQISAEAWAASPGSTSTLTVSAGVTGSCRIVLGDANGDSAELDFAFNNPTLIISGKARRN